MSFLSNIISASFPCNSLFSGFVRYSTHLFKLIFLIFHLFYALCIVLWSGKVLIEESEFKELYFKRWPVEVKFDIVKNKLELPIAIQKKYKAVDKGDKIEA